MDDQKITNFNQMNDWLYWQLITGLATLANHLVPDLKKNKVHLLVNIKLSLNFSF